MKPIGEPRWNRDSPPVAQRISAIRASSAVPRSAALQRRVWSRNARSLHSSPEGAIGARLPFVIDAIVILPGLLRK